MLLVLMTKISAVLFRKSKQPTKLMETDKNITFCFLYQIKFPLHIAFAAYSVRFQLFFNIYSFITFFNIFSKIKYPLEKFNNVYNFNKKNEYTCTVVNYQLYAEKFKQRREIMRNVHTYTLVHIWHAFKKIFINLILG